MKICTEQAYGTRRSTEAGGADDMSARDILAMASTTIEESRQSINQLPKRSRLLVDIIGLSLALIVFAVSYSYSAHLSIPWHPGVIIPGAAFAAGIFLSRIPSSAKLVKQRKNRLLALQTYIDNLEKLSFKTQIPKISMYDLRSADL